MLQPVLDGYDFVTPYYWRYKLDGTITNTIAYNLTQALYGMRIRQPIGGDFGVSLPLVKHYLDQEVWETDVAKFGIDIYMTTAAIVHGFKICQTRLGFGNFEGVWQRILEEQDFEVYKSLVKSEGRDDFRLPIDA